MELEYDAFRIGEYKADLQPVPNCLHSNNYNLTILNLQNISA